MSDLRKCSSKRKFSGIPMKMLLAQEMSKEDESKQSPPNLVAKLMGLDSLPMQLHSSISQRSRSNGDIRHSRSKSLSGVKKIGHSHHERSYSEMQMLHGYTEYGDYNDIYEMWTQSQSENSSRENSLEGKNLNEKRMTLVRQKFTEAKLLASDEKLRQSKQFQDAVEVLSSNRDLFIKLLQEPNSLISRHLHELQSIPPHPETKRITVLKPAKVLDAEKRTKKSSPVSGFSQPYEDVDGFAAQPTRIVLLKPGNGKAPGILHDNNLFPKVEDQEITESQELANETSENLTGNWRDASVFSNGGDSSFNKSEVEYVGGNCSDFEATSPVSRYSWEFLNTVESPCSSSSFSRASYSPESSVCREAKKRLSQRWALLASKQASLEQQTHHRRTSTLGEMLSLTDDKYSVTHEDQESLRYFPRNEIEVHSDSLRNPSRSKSSSSSTFHDESDSIEAPKEPTKKTNGLKWRLSSLFFSRKSKKENRDELQKSSATPDFTEHIHAKVGSSITNHLVDRHLRENHDQPRLISVLDHTFGDDDRESFGKNMSCHSLRSNLIGKSPPIGSMSRTLSWTESFLGSTSPCPTKPPSGPLFTEEEKQDLLDFIEILLPKSSLSWHSPETPLDPSLINTRSTQFNKEPPNESKHRQWRSNEKLVFDFVNAMIIENTHDNTILVSSDDVWTQMKGWFCNDAYGEDEDDETRLVLERVVKDAVIGVRWRENLRLEIDNLGMEIEKKLVEEFLDDAVVELFVR